MTRPHTHPPPEGWLTLMVPHWHTSEKVVRELWAAYSQLFPAKVPTLLFQLAAITDVIQAEAPHDALQPRMAFYINALEPQDLLRATLLLSPETGQKRRKDVV